MKLYHGSIQEVEIPLLRKCRKNTDFGRGFYTTTDLVQASRWAKIKQQRSKSAEAVVSVYTIDEAIFNDPAFAVFSFVGATEEWLHFVLANRNGMPTKPYDIINGPVANDNLYATLLLFEQGTFSVDNAIEKLKTYTLVNQISFHSEKVLKELLFEQSYLK